MGSIITRILTTREQELLNHLGGGFSRSEVCDRMFISPHTYDGHRKSIRQKLKIKSQADWAKILYLVV